MSTIGGVNPTATTPGATGAAPAGTTAAPAAAATLRDPRLSAHAPALAQVASGAATLGFGASGPHVHRMRELQNEINRDRASLLMKWMGAGGRPGVDPANVASYGIALATLTQLPDAQLEAEVAKLNDYARQQGSALKPLTAADVRRLDAALLTAETRDKPVRTDGAVERNLDGARFIFDRYMDAQKFLSETKGERVLRMLRSSGALRGITWETTEAAKGDTALRLLSGIR